MSLRSKQPPNGGENYDWEPSSELTVRAWKELDRRKQTCVHGRIQKLRRNTQSYPGSFGERARKSVKNTDFYTQLMNFESDEWHTAHTRNLEEESKLIEVGFEYVRYSEKEEVSVYWKWK